MEWLAGQEEDALSVICRAARVEGHGSLAALRTRRTLNEFGKDCTSWREREAWIKLGALLVILTSHNIQNALSIFDAQLNEIRPRDTTHESLTMACLMFIYRYGSVLKNPVPPSILRERVLQSMAYYPHNSVILALFLEVEKGQGVWGRIRGTLGDNTENVKDVARRVQEVWIAGWESGRWEAEIERTRIGLSGAVEHERYVLSVGSIPSSSLILINRVGLGDVPRYGESTLSSRYGQNSISKRKIFSTKQLGNVHAVKVFIYDSITLSISC